jgi:hypothetical protein
MHKVACLIDLLDFRAFSRLPQTTGVRSAEQWTKASAVSKQGIEAVTRIVTRKAKCFRR